MIEEPFFVIDDVPGPPPLDPEVARKWLEAEMSARKPGARVVVIPPNPPTTDDAYQEVIV